MINSHSLMIKSGESGLALLLAMQHAHHLLYIKSGIMKRAMNDLSWLQKIESDDKEFEKESELLTKELIRLELIANTVHYAEVFAASLLAMKRFKRFHKFLLEYKPREIIEFYKQIPNKSIDYVTSLLQYPPLHRAKPLSIKDELLESLNEMHDEIKTIAHFYLNWHEVYNAYKHGLRIAVSKPNPSEDFTVLAYPFSTEQLDTMKIHRTDEEVEKCISLCEFMWKILNNAESNFIQIALLQKNTNSEFTTEIFRRVNKQ